MKEAKKIEGQKETSVFPNDEIQFISYDTIKVDTMYLVGFLFVVMFVLKKFIYTKDPKRHGK
jgi:hypothetical protein